MEEKKPLSSADAVRAAASAGRKTEDITLVSGGTIRIKQISAAATIAFRKEVQAAVADGRDPDTLLPGLVAQSWINEDGEPLMPLEEGAEAFGQFGPQDYNAIAEAVGKLNGTKAGGGDGTDGSAVKSMGKPSEATPSESTSSGSPDGSDTPT